MKQQILILLALLFAFSGCVKEEDFEQITDQKIDPEELLSTHVYGLIRDAAKEPIEEALIQIKTVAGELSTLTDAEGRFSFDSVLITRSAYLQVQKTGYFDASRRMVVQPDRYNYTVIQMLERKEVGSFLNAQGGSFSLMDGSQISLPPDAVAYADGSGYSGQVHVKMNRIDPSSPDIFEQMPGNLSGYAEDGSLAAMASYGMLLVELESENGELLQLAPGKSAELGFVIPDLLQADAPDEIPLWYFDEEKGYWFEEGSARLEGDRYIGEVAHFTTWNCDKKGEVIDISGEIACANDVVLVPYLRVFLYQEDAPLAGGYLTEDGQFTFLNFFAEEVFTLKVLDQCDEVLWESDFGPYTEDTELGEILLDDCGDLIQISGEAVDCDGQAVSQGIVQFFSESGQFFKIDFEDGSFELSTISCASGDMSVVVTDVTNQKSSEEVFFNTSSGDEVDLGIVEVCDELDEYFIIYYLLPDGDMQEDTILFLDPSFKSYENEGYFIDFSNDVPDSTVYHGGNLGFSWNEIQLGSNIAQTMYYAYGDQGASEFYCQGGEWVQDPVEDIIADITTLELVEGGLVKGTFEGEVRTNTDEVKEIAGKFKVRVE
jgi:hypothetical protein